MSFSRMVVMLATARLRLGGQHLDAGTAVAHARERSDDDDDGDDDNDERRRRRRQQDNNNHGGVILPISDISIIT